ncbi:MAG: type I restriction enzyme HsdR N-terminal domain-containing protein, partial [Candidatus Wukongarchaeota archaeon]|nr:type I restriction enzyme HsdR N-terminal domain-containing protein [Candidatus Wukongarchaeota archaeon]
MISLKSFEGKSIVKLKRLKNAEILSIILERIDIDSMKKEKEAVEKVIVPFFQALGYKLEDLEFEKKIQIATTKISAYLWVKLDGVPFILVEAKNPKEKLSEKDVEQSFD